MFDQFKTHFAVWSGQFKAENVSAEHESFAYHVRKFYWAFLTFTLVAIMLLFYNAFMSLAFYSSIVENFTGEGSRAGALIATIAVAIAAFIAITGSTSIALNYIYNRREKTAGNFTSHLVIVLALIGFVGLDIYANLSGVQHVAHNTTTEIIDNPLSSVENKYEAQLTGIRDKAIADIKVHQDAIALLKSYKGKKHSCTEKACEKGVFQGRSGIPHNNRGKLNNWGLNVIDKHNKAIQKVRDGSDAQIAQVRKNQDRATSAASDDYNRDKGRYDGTVAEKETAHFYLVFFAYGIAIILTFFSNDYADKAMHILGKQKYQGTPFLTGNQQTGQTQSSDLMNALLQRLEGLETAITAQSQQVSQQSYAKSNPIKYRTARDTANETETPNPTPPVGVGKDGNEYGSGGGNTQRLPTVGNPVFTGDGWMIQCAHCGGYAVKQRKTAEYCSTSHRQAAYKLRSGKELHPAISK